MLKTRLVRLLSHSGGVTSIEYGMVVAALVVAVSAAIIFLDNGLPGAFGTLGDAIKRTF